MYQLFAGREYSDQILDFILQGITSVDKPCESRYAVMRLYQACMVRASLRIMEHVLAEKYVLYYQQ